MASQSDLIDAELYGALIEKNESLVLTLYKQFDDGAFHPVTIHGDTILHVALQSAQIGLVLKLLESLSVRDLEKIRTCKNRAGSTILHEAATSDDLVGVAAEILRLNPDSLVELNENSRESALYRAVRYGKIKMFKFLDAEAIKKYSKEDRMMLFYQNKEFTILHQAIINGHYELALWIAEKHEELIKRRDVFGVNALQHLARNPLAFKHRKYYNPRNSSAGNTNEKSTTAIQGAINVGGNPKDERTLHIPEEDEDEGGACCYLPKWESMKKKKRKYEAALKLAKLLIASDTTWKKTESVEDERIGDPTILNTTDQDKKMNIEETLTPLFIATKYGNVEIVKEILKVYPQAVEHIDEEGGTILHMAIKYGQIEVFDMVESMEVPMRRLVKKVDKQSNSILHMVGQKNAISANEEKAESPALLLQKNLHLYERVEKICSAHFFNHLNLKGQTAEQLFAENNKDLREKSQEWLKSTAQNCSIVAVLIATVAFAAAYTVPGGSKSDTGTPVLLNQTFFVIFAVTDVLSLTFTLTSVIIFLSILTSPFRLRDFKNALPLQLLLGVTSLILSVSMMMLAFSATIILMIRNNEEWKKVALYAVAFLPVSIFVYSYIQLFISLTDTVKYNLKKVSGCFPKFRFIGKN